MKNKVIMDTDVIEVLEYLIRLTGRRFRYVPSNAIQIKARLKEGFTKKELIEIIQIKTLEWKNNPTMSNHLNPITLFRNSNIDKYINQVQDVKNNPKRYKKYFFELNRVSDSIGEAFSKIDEMFGK